MCANGRPRVVVADDHPGVLSAALSILSRTCDVVGSAVDGLAAVEAALRLRPDIVVLDISMPRLDGFQAAARIKAAGSDARIVFFSNYTGDEFVLEALSIGASGLVAKTRMERDLLEAIDQAQAGRTFVPSARLLPRWRRRTGRRHDLQWYSTDAFLIDAVVDYFNSALEVGDSIIAVASAPHRHELDSRFRSQGVDIDAMMGAGRYVAVDSDEALETVLRGGRPDPDRWAATIEPLIERAVAASTATPRHASLFGEVAPILCAKGDLEGMTHLEQIAHQCAATHPLAILCAYSTETLPGDAAALTTRICSEHCTIVPAGI